MTETPPSREDVKRDLRAIANERLNAYTTSQLATLPSMGSLASPPGEQAIHADISAGIRRAFARISRPDLRDAARAIFGDTDTTQNLDLEARRDAAGRLCNPPVAGHTFRGKGKQLDMLLDDLAAILIHDELEFLRTGRSTLAGTPHDHIGQRPWFALQTEQRLGYRWVTYEQRLRGDLCDTWTEIATIEVLCLRENVEHFEFVYIAPAGQKDVQAEWRSAYSEAFMPAQFEPVRSLTVGVDQYNREVWRARLPHMQASKRGHKLAFRFTREATAPPQPNRHEPISEVIPLFDQMESLTFSVEHPPPISTDPGIPRIRCQPHYMVGGYHYFRLEEVEAVDEGELRLWRIANPIAGANYQLTRFVYDPDGEWPTVDT